MTLVLDDWIRTKRRVDELRRLADEARGAYKEALARVTDITGAQTLEEAERRLRVCTDELNKVHRTWVRKFDAFKAKWKKRLR